MGSIWIVGIPLAHFGLPLFYIDFGCSVLVVECIYLHPKVSRLIERLQVFQWIIFFWSCFLWICYCSFQVSTKYSWSPSSWGKEDRESHQQWKIEKTSSPEIIEQVNLFCCNHFNSIKIISDRSQYGIQKIFS